MNEIIEIPFGAKDSELGGWEYNIPEGYTASIENGKIIVKKEESKDEKIIKELIDFFQDWHKTKRSRWSVNVSDIIGWLEKQGEQKSIDKIKHKFKVGDKIKTTNEESLIITKIDKKGYWSEDLFICDFDEECLWDLVEQNPANRVKPKFHIGDYLVNEYCKGKVIALTDDAYLLDTEQGIPFSYEHNAHLLTIKDAEDGDVLSFYCECKGNKMVQIGIIEKYVGKHGGCSNTFKIHVGVNWENNLQIGEYMGCSDIRPATKEQRDALVKAIDDAGYIFDFEKKELKKIEQKPDDKEYTFKAIPRLLEMTQPTDRAKSYCQKLIDSLEQEGYSTDAKIVRNCLGRMNGERVSMATMDGQEYAWSEYDEIEINHILKTLTSVAKEQEIKGYNNLISSINWLKSIKDRVQPQWKPSDEHIGRLETAINYLDSIGAEPSKIVLTNLLEQLKKL